MQVSEWRLVCSAQWLSNSVRLCADSVQLFADSVSNTVSNIVVTESARMLLCFTELNYVSNWLATLSIKLTVWLCLGL